MKLLRFSAIFLAFMLMLGLASCDTTRRASRRIQNILNEHPELLDRDTIDIDTTLSVALPGDSTMFTLDDFYIADSNACTLTPADIITKHTEQGTFMIERLPGREGYIIKYLPDTLQIQARAKYAVPKITITHREEITLAQWLRIGVVIVIVFLFLRLFAKK